MTSDKGVALPQHRGSSDHITAGNLNEADMAHFSNSLIYAEFEGNEFASAIDFAAYGDSGMPMYEYCQEMSTALQSQLVKVSDPSDRAVLENRISELDSLASNPRYQNVTISNPACQETDTQQWAALTINLNDGSGTSVLSFRGTNGTGVGWREDFELAYKADTEAQRSSQEYLEQYVKDHPDASVILTGHSKGGNDAIYAYAASDKNVRDHVLRVYDFDGPGLKGENEEKYAEALKELESKLELYFPQDSVIGQLLNNHVGNRHYVYSDADSIMYEHDPGTWYFYDEPQYDENGNLIYYRPEPRSELSIYIDKVLDDTIASLSNESLETLITVLADMGIFEIIAGTDSRDKAEIIYSAIMTLNGLPDEEKLKLINVLSQLLFAAEYEFSAAGGYEWLEETIVSQIEKTKNGAIEKVNAFFDCVGPIMELLGMPDGLIREITSLLIEGIAYIAEQIVSWVIKKIKNRGSKKTYPKETIDVNMSVLKTSKSRLEYANKVIHGLDSKLDAFRKALGKHEMIDRANAADIDFEMTGSNIGENIFEHITVKGYNVNINNCVGYLEAVITQLNSTEESIIRAVGGA